MKLTDIEFNYMQGTDYGTGAIKEKGLQAIIDWFVENS